MNAQHLFDRFNRKYWRGCLPHYNVLVTNKYYGGLCKKQLRTIYINPVNCGSIPRTLMHEMAHAAVRGNGHARVWQNEIRRLIRLGAPLKTELSQYSRRRRIGIAQIRGSFYDAGVEAEEDVTWKQVRLGLGYENGLVDIKGRATNKTCARYLENMRRAWLLGREGKQRTEKAKAAFLEASKKSRPADYSCEP